MLEIIKINKKTKSIETVSINQAKEFLADANNLLWIDIEYPPDVWPNSDEMNLLENVLKIHPLNIEDCVAERHQPKIEEMPDYLFLIIYGMKFDENNILKLQDIELFLGNNFVISYRHEKISEIENIKASLKSGKNHIYEDAASLFHTICDKLIDNYLLVIDQYDIQIDRIEDVLFKKPSKTVYLQRLSKIRGNINSLRRLIVTTGELFFNLSRGYYERITESDILYFRDIYDHLHKDISRLDGLKDTISGIFDIQLNLSSQRLNEIIKFLTIISTILLPSNLIAGIFGMNFEKLAFLHANYGFASAILMMIIIAIIMLVYFKNKKWI